MKYQQVSVDLVNMITTACSYLVLIGVAWIFLRLLQACFWLPRHLRKQNDVQRMLQDKVDSYEKYLMDCEAKDRASGNEADGAENDEQSAMLNNVDKWKEQRECLEMLKRELKKVRDGGDINDWDYLLEEDNVQESATLSEIHQDDDGDGGTKGSFEETNDDELTKNREERDNDASFDKKEK